MHLASSSLELRPEFLSNSAFLSRLSLSFEVRLYFGLPPTSLSLSPSTRLRMHGAEVRISLPLSSNYPGSCSHLAAWSGVDTHLPPTARIGATDADSQTRFDSMPCPRVSAARPPSPTPPPTAATRSRRDPSGRFDERLSSTQEPETAFFLYYFACLTGFGFAQGPEVPAPRLALLPASRGKPGTAVSARHVAARRARRGLASLARAFGAHCFRPQFLLPFRISQAAGTGGMASGLGGGGRRSCCVWR